MKFTHLRTCSGAPINKGTLTVDKIIELALKNNQTATALTDDGLLIWSLQHYEEARKKGLNPIIGIDMYVQPDITDFPEADRNKILLIAKNKEGYLNMLDLVSRSYTENKIGGIACLKQSWLNKETTKGIIALSGTFENSDIANGALSIIQEEDPVLKKENYIKLEKTVKFYQNNIDEYYLEIQRMGKPHEDDIINAYLGISQKLGIPIVATNPVEFAERKDFISNEIRACSNKDRVLYDVNRENYSSPEQYFKSTEEMYQIFKGLEFALENSNVIADKCKVEIDLGVPQLPSFPTPNGEDEAQYFIDLTRQKFEAKMEYLFPDEAERKSKYAEYKERLETEIKCIVDMGFPGYFLIVQDFINWSEENGVAVGPGRGSGAGSLVALSLGITKLDPIHYDLQFERFLNPERVSMPDFDIDFSPLNRERVIQYVKDKYGSNYVAQIITTNNDKAKSLFKSVRKVTLASVQEVNNVTKFISKEYEDKSLKEIYDNVESFRNTIEGSETLQEIYEHLSILDVLPKAVGIHAAGVVITKEPTSHYSAVYVNDQGQSITMFDKNDIEKAGGVKFDFLGLKNLDVIVSSLEDVKKEYNKDINIDKIDLEDQNVLEMFRRGNTANVFQFSSKGMQQKLIALKPRKFEDVISMVALYRPGPLESGMVEHFIERANGREKISYPEPDFEHPLLKPVLENTYGVILYQEQVMKIAQVLAGYSLGQADLLRRAMGKKKPEEMAKQKSVFRDGAIKNGVDGDLALHIFDIVEKFSGYGFNKSHSAAYSVVSFQTAFLKTYYPAIYLKNVINYEDKFDKIKFILEDAKANNVEIVLPDINKSDLKFSAKENTIIYGLSKIKSVGEKDINIILEERKKGDFKSFDDFYARTFDKIGKKTIEVLIQAGAFESLRNPNRLSDDEIDSLNPRRNQAELLKNLDNLNDLANKIKKTLASIDGHKKSQFPTKRSLATQKRQEEKRDALLEEFNNYKWQEVDPPTLTERTEYEFKALGFYYKYDLLSSYLDHFNGLNQVGKICDIEKWNAQSSNDRNNMLVAGIVLQAKSSAKGQGRNIQIMGAPDIEDENLKEIDAFDPEKEAILEEKDDLTPEEEEEKIREELAKRNRFFYVKNEFFKENQNKLAKEKFVVLDVSVSKAKDSKYGKNSAFVNKVYSFEEVEQLLVKTVHLALNPKEPDRILHILKEHPGKIPVMVYLPKKDGSNVIGNYLKKELFINGSKECIAALRNSLGKNSVKLEFKDKLIADQTYGNNFVRPKF